MLARKKTTTRVYRSCCTVPAEPSCLQSLQFPDPAMLQTQTEKVLKIVFQQSLRGLCETCKEMREFSQQSLRGHSQTCKEMRILPTELEGSEPDLQRDEGELEQPIELEGSEPDLQRDEDVFQQSLSRWKAAISRDLQHERDFFPACPQQQSTCATLLLLEGCGEEGATHAPDQGDHRHLAQLHLQEGAEGEKEPRRSRYKTTFGRLVSVPRQCA